MSDLAHRAAAASELLKRRALHGSLTEWCRFAGFEPALHHQLVIRELESLERGEIDRLAISMPPGSGKTTYASHAFPCWYLARNPEHLVLSGSHTQEFSERKIGRKVRNLIERHGRSLGIELDPSSRSMTDWSLLSGGAYKSVGVGTAVQGERADLAIVEDPYPRWEDAQSATTLDNVWEWFVGDFTPRLKPNAKRVIIATRFHELDLIGRLMERDPALGFSWRHIRIPMLAENDDPLGRDVGDRLWPDWFTEQQVTEARADAMKWSALYQQRPSPETGDYFKAEWCRPYTKVPARETLRVYGGSDFAVTADGGDFTVHAVVGLDPEGRMYLLDIWRKRTASDEWIEALCDLILEWDPMGWATESGQIKSGVGPFLQRRQRERGAYVAMNTYPTRGDKSIRAQSFRGRMALEGLYVPTYAHWWPDVRAEMLSFPAGKHDDVVDALGLVGQLLDQMVVGRKAAVHGPILLDRYNKPEPEVVTWKTI